MDNFTRRLHMVLTSRSMRIVLFAIFLFAPFFLGTISHGHAASLTEAYVEPFFIQFNNEEVLAENPLITKEGKNYVPFDDVLQMLNGEIQTVEDRYHVTFSLIGQPSIKINETLPQIQLRSEVPTLTFEETVYAHAAAIIENGAENVMFSKNGHKKLYPASTTKIMTALIAIETSDLNQLVTVSEEVRNIPGDSSRAHIQPGDQLTLRQLIYAMMIPSGNDAAVAVAAHVAGSEKEFVKLMNKKAKEIGATNTNFVNPHGYHDPKQHTTAIDLAKIAYEASKYDEFFPFVSTPRYTITYKQRNGNSVTRTWTATNQQIRNETSNYSPMITGGKTGFTSASRHTLVSFAHHGDQQYTTVILKGDRNQRYADTVRLVQRAIGEREAHDSHYKKSLALSYNEKSIYVNDELIDFGEKLFTYNGRLYVPEALIKLLLNQLQAYIIEKTHFKTVFNDVSDEFWAKEEIDYLTTKQIINGFPDQTFRPNAKLNRLQVAIMISRLPLPFAEPSRERKFINLPKDHSHYEAVNKVVQNGYFDQLMRNNEFRPNQEVTRAEIAYILSSVFELTGESEMTFLDVDQNHWAYDDIQALAANNVTLGYPDLTFKPDETVNRVQFSVFMARSMNDYFKPRTDERHFMYWGTESNFFKTCMETERTTPIHPYGVSQHYVVGNYVYFLSETYRHMSDRGAEPHGQIYRINKDGSNKIRISEDIVEAFGIVEDKILYSYTGKLGKDGYVIYGTPSIKSMNLNGKNQKKIADIRALDLRSENGWIYFTNSNDGDKLYRMKKDGSKIEEL